MLDSLDFAPQVPVFDGHVQVGRPQKGGRMRAVRAAPRLGLYPFAPWVVDPWLGWLSETGRGLWVSLDEVDPGEFHAAVERHPQLRVVLSDGHYRHHAIIMGWTP